MVRCDGLLAPFGEGTRANRLGSEAVLVDQPAEPVASTDAIVVDGGRGFWLGARRHRLEGRPLLECAVQPVLVEALDVGREDAFEVMAADDQDPVEAFTADAADPTLGVRPRVRRLYGRFDHSYPPGFEHLVEVGGELAPRKHVAECRQQSSISLRQLRTSDVPLEHPKLVAQKEDLDLFLPLRTEA